MLSLNGFLLLGQRYCNSAMRREPAPSSHQGSECWGVKRDTTGDQHHAPGSNIRSPGPQNRLLPAIYHTSKTTWLPEDQKTDQVGQRTDQVANHSAKLSHHSIATPRALTPRHSGWSALLLRPQRQSSAVTYTRTTHTRRRGLLTPP